MDSLTAQQELWSHPREWNSWSLRLSLSEMSSLRSKASWIVLDASVLRVQELEKQSERNLSAVRATTGPMERLAAENRLLKQKLDKLTAVMEDHIAWRKKRDARKADASSSTSSSTGSSRSKVPAATARAKVANHDDVPTTKPRLDVGGRRFVARRKAVIRPNVERTDLVP